MNFEEEIRDKIRTLDDRVKAIEELLKTKPAVKEKALSLREFINSKKPKGDVEKTLVIGFFLENMRGFECFTGKDLESGFKESREKVPANINDKINKNIERAFMMEFGEKNKFKTWSLTNKGTLYVENNFKEDK